MQRHRGTPWMTLVVAATALLIAACGSSPPAASASLTPPAPSATTTPAPASLKPPLRGLLDRNGEPPAALLSAMGGWVVNVYWNQLQTTQGAPLPADNVIDQAIATVRALNAADHLDLGLRLRIFAGVDAPNWAKSIGGAPVSLVNPQSGATGLVGRFWTEAFGGAYDAFQAELAARYDAVPEVREVTVARCMTFYDEPLIRDVSSTTSVANLVAAGFTATDDAACQEQEITSAGEVWHHTRVDVAFNPYQEIDGTGTVLTNETFTKDLMDFCRAALGQQCVLENNSLRTTPLGPAYSDMYASMAGLGPPISFQTATEARVGDLSATVQYALELRAESVELPSGYQSVLASSTLSSLTSELAAVPVS